MGISSLADIVRTYAAAKPDAPALELNNQELTWAELYGRAQQVAGALAADGVQPQQHVCFLDKNGFEHFEVQYGAALANIVTVDVNWRLAGPEIAYIVNDCSARVLVVGPDFVPVLDAMAGELSPDLKIVVIGGHESYQSYDEWLASAEPVDPHTPSANDDICLQMYSSGTTGRPKGVMISNDNIIALLPTGVDLWDITSESINLVAMPLFHIGGSGWAIVGQFVGAKSVILREVDPVELIRLLSTRGVTHGFVVPVVLQFLLMMPGVQDADFSSLKMIAYGASPISDDVLEKSIELLKCDFWQVYGLTETTGAIVNLPPEDHDVSGPNRHRLRSCGVPGPGVELRIVDPDTATDAVLDGETGKTAVGEIWIRSPQVMKGYWNNPEATADAIDSDGWFRTGDAGYLDADGYVYIHDRVKDMIVSGGENVYPAEVENVLMAHPSIADVAVIGVPDDKWGETAKAVVVLAPGAELAADDLIAYSRDRLARFKCPTSVDYVDALPRNPSGKILKKDLREPYWQGRDRNVN